MITRQELKTLIWPGVITVIAFGFLIWLWPHTSMYKEARELAWQNDSAKAAYYASAIGKSPFISQEVYDGWFDEFEKKWGVSRSIFEPTGILERSARYLNDEK